MGPYRPILDANDLHQPSLATPLLVFQRKHTGRGILQCGGSGHRLWYFSPTSHMHLVFSGLHVSAIMCQTWVLSGIDSAFKTQSAMSCIGFPIFRRAFTSATQQYFPLVPTAFAPPCPISPPPFPCTLPLPPLLQHHPPLLCYFWRCTPLPASSSAAAPLYATPDPLFLFPPTPCHLLTLSLRFSFLGSHHAARMDGRTLCRI